LDTRYRNGALLVSGLLIAVWLAPIGRAQDINPSVRIDGAPLKADTPALLDRSAGRTLIPARSLAEAMGYKVTWDAETQTVRAEQAGHQIAFRIGAMEATADGQPVALDVAPRLVKGRAMVPLRFFAEASGARVEWDEQTKSVDITSPTSEAGAQSGTASLLRSDGTDRFTGKALALWSSEAMSGTDRGLGNPPATGDGLIYATTDEGKLYAINRENGATAWSADIDGGYPSTPLYDADRGRVYLTNGNGQLLAFNAETGKRIWFAAIRETQEGRSQPVSAGDLIVVNAGDTTGSTLAAFSPDTGSKVWQVPGPGAGPMTAFGARLFVQDPLGAIHAYRKGDGSPLWQYDAARQDKALEGGSLLVAAGRVYAAGANRVLALDEATGKLVWSRQDVNMASYGGMTTNRNELWVVVADGVMALDTESGATILYPAICKSGQSTPVLTAGHAFLACDGQIYAINRSSYEVAKLTAGQGALTLDGDRMYYTTLDDFRLSALMALPER
jgi:outer membrane protein assembly factor BamB